MSGYAAGSLLDHLSNLNDPRDPKGQRHPFQALLAASCAAILCGARGPQAIAEWVKAQPIELLHKLRFKRKPPCQNTYRNLFLAIDTADLDKVLCQFVSSVLDVAPDQLRVTPLDGKTLKGACDRIDRATHLLSLLDEPTGCVLHQCLVPQDTNEHKQALELLDDLVLGGRIVTGDAMFCHKDVAQTILDCQADYFLAVKGNQPELLEDIQAAFEPPFSP